MFTLLFQLAPIRYVVISYQRRYNSDASFSFKTVSSMMTFVSAMVKYPDVLSQVQKELDSVLGRYHLPTFDDQESLPYLMATVKECLRWKNASQFLGAPLHLLIYIAL